MEQKQPQKSNHVRAAADYRRRHRQAQHEEAHAAGDAPETASDSSTVTLGGVFNGKPEVIQAQAGVDAVVERLRAAGTFAYDTEFIGEMSYRPQVCLIQVATEDYVGLIDPLSGVDLSDFWQLLVDPTLHKIVHAGEQDLEHVFRATGKSPANVLDTQVVAGLIGLSYPASLAKLVLEFTGIKLHKGFTFTDWTVRPLSGSQLKYAADDVRYLPAIAHAIRERLGQLDRLDWALEECAARCANAKPGFNPETSWQKVRGSGSLDGKGINVLKLLVAWREALAESADVPARTFLKDEILIDLCRNKPKSTDRLGNIRHLPRPVIEHHGQELIDLVSKGLAMPPAPVDDDGAGEPSLTDKFRFDSVWAIVQTVCAAQSIDPALVTSRQDTIDVYRSLARGSDVEGERLLSGWRAAAVGNTVRQLAAGTFDFAAKWDGRSVSLGK